MKLARPPKVSICIPAYKQADFLRRTLASVVLQSFEDYEIIVTDDSRDTSVEEVVREFLPNRKLYYYKNSEIKGSPENWNEAIRHASGEYIKILHHDDWFAGKESLGTYVKMLDDNPKSDFAFSATNVVSARRNTTRIYMPSKWQLKRLKDDPAIMYFANCIGAPSATIYRRNLGFEYDVLLKWLVDVDFYIRVLMRNRSYEYSNIPLICTTDDAPHQVTNECISNKDVQLFEYIHLYKKIYRGNKYDLKLFIFFGKLLGRFGVTSVNELYEAGVSEPIPKIVLKTMEMRKCLEWFGVHAQKGDL